ncbi:XRE family transcriptional regulator [Synechococcus sp. PCC 6312]|uniref:XRE family transcriptional regulator n=1 Tax=Synechococcus sp. (strain ATCC 27167 / PCC 6312) TaxID=195253 RepID=UPI00030725D7|nr:XRE family transcriptional regulator [Synechococcus sp. PCC 6312]
MIKIVINQNVSDAELAEILKIDITQVVALMSGKLSEFSAPELFQFLNALDQDVKIVVGPKSQPQARTCVIASS